jgi:hypothetical protein
LSLIAAISAVEVDVESDFDFNADEEELSPVEKRWRKIHDEQQAYDEEIELLAQDLKHNSGQTSPSGTNSQTKPGPSPSPEHHPNDSLADIDRWIDHAHRKAQKEVKIQLKRTINLCADVVALSEQSALVNRQKCFRNQKSSGRKMNQLMKTQLKYLTAKLLDEAMQHGAQADIELALSQSELFSPELALGTLQEQKNAARELAANIDTAIRQQKRAQFTALI